MNYDLNSFFAFAGGSRDIGTCLTRIVIRHRALESRMNSTVSDIEERLTAFEEQPASKSLEMNNVIDNHMNHKISLGDVWEGKIGLGKPKNPK